MFCKVSVSHTDSYPHTASAFNELHKIPISNTHLHNLCATILSLMHSCMIKLIYPTHKWSQFSHTQGTSTGTKPSFSFFFFQFLPPLFSVFHSSERIDEKRKETRKDAKLIDQCRQPYKDQTLSPTMIHNPC